MSEELLRAMNREIGEISTKVDTILEVHTTRLNDHAGRLQKVEKHSFGIKVVIAAFASAATLIGWDKLTDLFTKGGGS
jgi:hypothetical protein